MNKTILTGEVFNKTITTVRTSGLKDTIPVATDQCGYFRVEGSLHTYNTPDKHLRLYVQPDTITQSTEPSDNTITLTGYLCRSPKYRTTPGGREITELLIAAPRQAPKADYIPCIAWGANARRAQHHQIGDEVTITGRIQSREYLKDDEPHTTYEVSITTIN